MRKLFLSILIIFIVLSKLSGDQLKLLKIEEPSDTVKGKNILLVNLADVEAIIKDFNLQGISGFIELAELDATSVARLGTVKKGKVKWRCKIVKDKYLKVKFKKTYFSLILERIRKKSMRPGLRLQLVNPRTKISSDKHGGKYFGETKIERERYITNWREIIFTELPDLVVRLEYPVKVRPGEDVSKNISIIVENQGTTVAENFCVDLALSKYNHINIQKTSTPENFVEDITLKNGRLTIAQLKSNESKTLTLEKSVLIPAEISLGQYHLRAFVDVEKKVKELDDENNVFTGFILISVPAPKIFFVDMPDTRLIYNPTSFELKILCQGSILSDGKDWRKCKIKPYIHQIKHVSWSDIFWEINTIEKGVYLVRSSKFCKTGGTTVKELKIKMVVKGGSRAKLPAEITLKLEKTLMQYEPALGNLKILTQKNQIAYLPFWKAFKLYSHIYRIKNTILWKNYFWEVDTYRKAVNVITDGSFTKKGGTKSPLKMKVRVE